MYEPGVLPLNKVIRLIAILNGSALIKETLESMILVVLELKS